MNKILFIGSFFSNKLGTISISEKLKDDLYKFNFDIKLASNYQNKILRFSHIIFAILFSNYSLLHFDTFSGQAFYITQFGSLIGKLRRKKIIFTLRGGALPVFFNRNNENRMKKVLNRGFIQTPSLYLQNFFSKNNLNCDYLPNPINFDYFPFNREKVVPHSILWVRAFDKIYNPEIAVKVLNILLQKYPNSTLTMVGPDKGKLNEIEILINSLGLNKYINITGPISNNLLYKYYQTHHIYINTTSYESFGVALFEAASCGIPIVSTNVGEIPYLWTHNKNILVVNDFNINDFSFEISRIFENRIFENNLSINARKNAELFSWNIIREKWIETLTK